MEPEKPAGGVAVRVEATVVPRKPCDEPCPKCGGSDVWREFWKKNDGRDAKKFGRTENKYETADGWRLFATRDHLRNRCRCCSYEWKTLPIKKPNARLQPTTERSEGGRLQGAVVPQRGDLEA